LFHLNPNPNPRNLRKENPNPNPKNPRKELESFAKPLEDIECCLERSVGLFQIAIEKLNKNNFQV
jgi:exonuclease VII small subunit